MQDVLLHDTEREAEQAAAHCNSIAAMVREENLDAAILQSVCAADALKAVQKMLKMMYKRKYGVNPAFRRM